MPRSPHLLEEPYEALEALESSDEQALCEELARLDGNLSTAEAAEAGEDIGRELFRLVVKAREAGRDPEMELRAAARRYRDLVRAGERS
jgi:hypothetical protein